MRQKSGCLCLQRPLREAAATHEEEKESENLDTIWVSLKLVFWGVFCCWGEKIESAQNGGPFDPSLVCLFFSLSLPLSSRRAVSGLCFFFFLCVPKTSRLPLLSPHSAKKNSSVLFSKYARPSKTQKHGGKKKGARTWLTTQTNEKQFARTLSAPNSTAISLSTLSTWKQSKRRINFFLVKKRKRERERKGEKQGDRKIGEKTKERRSNNKKQM